MLARHSLAADDERDTDLILRNARLLLRHVNDLLDISRLEAGRHAPSYVRTDVAKLMIAPRREHSRKPDETHDRIERLVDGPYLELFARASRPGWDRFGNQAGLFDAGSVPTRRRPSTARSPSKAAPEGVR